jgi:hypothetical protein
MAPNSRRIKEENTFYGRFAFGDLFWGNKKVRAKSAAKKG